ncbi:endolysin [Streptomyces phage Hank144]|uniref:Endolysin n=1 Tax=Streptomyces phage Hank144 TaxID=2301573 RepID=A0A385DNT4_9CAUD|nr:endolysin [Streptomyces phage Hank144]AXQ61083.1 endolysin [Streptomyces phage Hank144]
MSVNIISRSEWGAQPWNGNPSYVALSQRTEFFVHYDGGTPITYTGVQVPRAIDRTHQNQGWAGIGYNFVVDQDGNIYEGRGWERQGAHCPNHNVSGIGVQIAIGGSQEPSAKALAACRALYDEACRKTGRKLAKKGHKDGFATACPGTKLYAWVKAGMPAGDYDAPDAPSGSTVARYQVTINGLKYGYGAKGDHVTKVGKALVAKGFGKHYAEGPGPTWSDADTKNYADFQRSLGYSGSDADGVPGEGSLKKLLGTLPSATASKPAPKRYEPFPGAAFFKRAPRSAIVTAMGKRLVAEGCGVYSSGPGPQWTESDRKSYAKWQRKLGYSGADADGYPGKTSWDKLHVPEV